MNRRMKILSMYLLLFFGIIKLMVQQLRVPSFVRKPSTNVFAFSIIFLSSCTKDSGPIIIRPPVDTLSYTDTILPIFLGKCVNCHPGFASLDLGVTNGYNDLVNVNSINFPGYKRVTPHDPQNSVLYQKVAGNSQFGTMMPLYADRLTDDEIGLIYDWIAQGAMNN